MVNPFKSMLDKKLEEYQIYPHAWNEKGFQYIKKLGPGSGYVIEGFQVDGKLLIRMYDPELVAQAINFTDKEIDLIAGIAKNWRRYYGSIR